MSTSVAEENIIHDLDLSSYFDVNLKNQEVLHVLGVGDCHIGSQFFNKEYFEYTLNKLKALQGKSKLIIYLNGDILECASKHVGDAAFKQILDVDEQIDLAVEYFEPFKKSIRGITLGNHEYRLVKDYGSNPLKQLAKRLDIAFKPYIYDKFTINNEHEVRILAKHGMGKAARADLAYGKVHRETVGFNQYDICFYGHLHHLGHDRRFKVDLEGVNNKTLCKPDNVVLVGNFLKYNNSYAHLTGLSPLPEGYMVCRIDKNKRITFEPRYIYEEKPELMDLEF